jgi:hypothetical protein
MGNNGKLCPAIWFSGFFGLGAFVHLVRSILKFPLIVGDFEVSITTSVILAVVLGTLSLVLLYVGCKRPCCKKE